MSLPLHPRSFVGKSLDIQAESTGLWELGRKEKKKKKLLTWQKYCFKLFQLICSEEKDRKEVFVSLLAKVIVTQRAVDFTYNAERNINSTENIVMYS